MKELIEYIPNEIDDETGAITEMLYFLNDDVTSQLVELQKLSKEIEEKEKEIKKALLEEMEAKGITKIHAEGLSITYIAPTQRETFDSKAFKEANPDLYDEYVKFTNVSSSVRFKLK